MNTQATPPPVRLICAFVILFCCPPLLADNPGSCALTVVNDTADDCYTITPPTANDADFDLPLNAVIDEPIWSDAIEKTFGGPGTPEATVQILRAPDALYIAITAEVGTDAPDNDFIRIYIDPIHSNDTSLGSDEFRFSINRNLTSPQVLKQQIGVSAETPWVNNCDPGGGPNSQVCFDTDGANWTMEAKIVSADLGYTSGAPELPSIFGIAVEIADQQGFVTTTASWPDASFDETNPATWANLKTRYPIEYMLVLDHSGSMLSNSKWDNATTAANYLANTMAIFNQGAYFRDELGVVTFAWLCSGSDLTTAVNMNDDGDKLAAVGPFPLGDLIDDLGIVPPANNNCTPIASGINTAFTEVGTAAEQAVQRVFLVLSDGLHNRPNSSMDLGDLDYVPCARVPLSDWSPCEDSEIEINTIAFGPSGSVDEMLLDNIATYYQGALGASTYHITSDPTELKGAFIATLHELYQLNQIPLASPGGTFPVDPNNQRLVVIAAWNSNPMDADNFTLSFDADASGTFEPGEEVSCEIDGRDQTVGFAVCTVERPEGGNWRANATGADQVFPLLDLNLRARFAVEQIVHGTGSDILITADLNEAGLPLTHDPAAHPVSVSVNIRQPNVGLGTLLATTDTNTCRQGAPQLPPVNADPIDISAVVGSASTKKTPGDPPNALYALAANLAENCPETGIEQTETSALVLLDDGTQGDVTAGDGIYTLRFNDTELEGSYIFQFTANGQSHAGFNFARTKAFSAYVRLEVTADNTEFDFRDISVGDQLAQREYYVIPQDEFGGYFGPGRAEAIQFQVAGGTAVGGVKDYFNGIYAQLVEFNPELGEPDVKVIVQGKTLVFQPQPERPGRLCGEHPVLCILVIILLLILLIILIIYLKRRRH